MPEHVIRFAKIVATPTDTGWSQLYNAGNVYAVLSLHTTEPQDLRTAGKTILNELEAEFFTLEEKNLTTIKEAITATLSQVAENVSSTLLLAFHKDEYLYLFLHGKGSVILKRSDKQSHVLKHAESETQTEVHTSSGKLISGDIIILASEQFSSLISDTALSEALTLETPDEIAEALSPTIHQSEIGEAAAVILFYKTLEDAAVSFPTQEENDDEHEEEQSEIDETEDRRDITKREESTPSLGSLPTDEMTSDTDEPTKRTKRFAFLPRVSLPISIRIGHKQKVFLSIAVILFALLIGSVFFTISKKQNQQAHSAFQGIYTSAQKDYDEGVGLLNLNKPLAREELLNAQKTLAEGLPQFKKGSDEERKLSELLAKVETSLATTSSQKTVEAKEAEKDASVLLNAALAQKGVLAATQNEETIYLLTKDAVLEQSKTADDAKELIANDETWKKPQGIGVFGSNVYVLDQGTDLLKLVATANGYTDTSYFVSGEKPDLTKAVAMAIDGSVWILFSDGAISKFTKGATDTFTISGLDTPLRTPTEMVTDAEMKSLYVLDAGNSRVVKFAKNGTFEAEYASPLLAKTTVLDVKEKDNELFFLADGKIWQIAL